MRRTLLYRIVALSAIPVLFASALAAQAPIQTPVLATGNAPVTEPEYPDPYHVCAILTAKFSASQRNAGIPPVVDPVTHTATPADDTKRITDALTKCSGGSAMQSVVLEADADNPLHNAFFTGPITVRGVTLVIDPGVTLYGNNSYFGASQLISLVGHDAAIMGKGTGVDQGAIDGRADRIQPSATLATSATTCPLFWTPRLINTPALHAPYSNSRLTVYNITLRQAAKQHVYIQNAGSVVIWGVNINSPVCRPDAGGVTLDGVHDATITNSILQAGDDGIAIKASSGPSANITVSNNKLYGTHGLSIGSETSSGVSNVLFVNNSIDGKDQTGANYSTGNNGLRIQSDCSMGGSVKQITYTNTCMQNVQHPLLFTTHNEVAACASTATNLPSYTDIVVNGLYATKPQSGAYSQFNGLDAAHPLGLYLANINLANTLDPAGKIAVDNNAQLIPGTPPCSSSLSNGQECNQQASVHAFHSTIKPIDVPPAATTAPTVKTTTLSSTPAWATSAPSAAACTF